MLKKLLVVAALAFWAQLGFAATEVNTADKTTLQSIKDVGPKTADAILAERTKGGNFKDWNDLVKRVKGVGPKNSVLMSQEGLTVNGQVKPNAPISTTTKKATAKPVATVEKASKDVKSTASVTSATVVDTTKK